MSESPEGSELYVLQMSRVELYEAEVVKVTVKKLEMMKVYMLQNSK